MTFHSLDFVAFFVIVTAVYWRLPHRGQNWFLLVASYLFYGWFEPWFCLLLAGTTLVDWYAGLRMDRDPALSADAFAHPDDVERRRRRWWLILSLVSNLAVLGFFSSYDPIDDAGTIWYLISHFEFRCGSGSYRVTQTDSYDAEHRLANSAAESEEWAAIPADSYVESLRAFACDNVRAGAVGNPFDAADAYFEEDG